MLLTKAAHPKDVMLHDFALALLNKKAQEDNAHHKHARYTMIGKTFEHKGPLHPDHLISGCQYTPVLWHSKRGKGIPTCRVLVANLHHVFRCPMRP